MESTNTPGWIVSRVLQDATSDFQPLAELNDDPAVKEALDRLYNLPPERMLKMARLFTTLADDFEEALDLDRASVCLKLALGIYIRFGQTTRLEVAMTMRSQSRIAHQAGNSEESLSWRSRSDSMLTCRAHENEQYDCNS